MENTIRILDLVVKLVSVLTWPTLFFLVFFHFKADLSNFISNLSEADFQGGGAKLSLKRLPPEAVAKLAAATAASDAAKFIENPTDTYSSNTRNLTSTISKSVQSSIESAQSAATPRALQHARNAKILWVDDNPSNNFYEQQALEALGIRISRANSTEEALQDVRSNAFDIIISDMGRPESKKAGFELLENMNKMNFHTPFIIYTSIGTPSFNQEAKSKGAFGATNMPGTLIKLVLDALQTNYR